MVHCGDAYIDRKIGFQGFPSGRPGSFSVLCSCRLADYDSRLPSARGGFKSANTGLRREQVYTHTVHSHTHSQTHLRIYVINFSLRNI